MKGMTMDILKEAFEDGKFLATVDGVEYREVRLVCDKSAAGVMPYCTVGNWQTNPVALLAKRDAEIEALKAKIKELEGTQEKKGGGAITCSVCGQQFTHPTGLAGHRFKKHGLKGSIALA